MMDKLEEMHFFTTPVYVVQKPDFLQSVKSVSDKYIAEAKKNKKKNYVVLMTGTYAHEPEIADFARYVSQTAWNILASQGYAMDNMVTFFMEMWTQEHNNMSSMETHVHGRGSQISAFYFLDVPKNSCKLMIHDPRSAKVIISLPEASAEKITNASQQIVLTPQNGTLIFTNAWTPHSFSKNFSKETMRFVHMNLSVSMAPQEAAEVL
jgi:uncharacterized protein (TIGR02466 family)